MKQPALNITIPVFNRLELTKQTLTTLHACRNDSVSFCITVVDNGSEPALVKLLIEFHQSAVIDNLFLLPKNMGISCAANIGWELVPAEYYMKLDNDMGIKDTGWLSKIFTLWGYGAPLSNIGPLWEYLWKEGPIDFMQTPAGLLGLCPANLPGASIIIPSTIQQHLGMWSEDYGLYGADDGDYGLRMLYGGFPQYYYISNPFIEHLGTGDEDKELYAKAGIDKKQAHKDLFFEQDGSAGGLFRLNRYLYKQHLRTFKVARRYAIIDVDSKHQVHVEERKEYKSVAKALAHCRTLLSAELKRRGGAAIDELEFKEQMARIMRACGQEFTPLQVDAELLKVNEQHIIGQHKLFFDERYTK